MHVLSVVSAALMVSLVRVPGPTKTEGQIGPISASDHVSGGHSTTMGNPAAVYCQDVMGYEYDVVKAPGGGQMGVCILPNGEECNQWDFYEGACGQRYSYCAQHGYRVETRSGGGDPFSTAYAVCISSDEKVMGSVAQLSRLHAKVTNNVNEWDADPRGGGSVDNSNQLRGPAAPSSVFDWRSYQGHNWLTGVKNQGSCGSCWAFAAVGVAEAYHNIMSVNPNLDLDLAEQDLVSCSFGGSCSGGSSTSALLYMQNVGIVDENCMPYTASDSSCDKCSDWQDRLTYIDETNSFSPDRQSIQQNVVDYGPIYDHMGIGSEYGGYFDGSGTYRCSDDSGTNHVVVIVGYNDAGGYWIVRNSWGVGWNDGGYFHVGYDECSIDGLHAGYVYNIPPTGQITAPSDGDGINTCPLTIQAEADDGGSGVDFVEFHAYYDDSWHHLGDDSVIPYSWDPYVWEWDCSSVSDQVVWLTIHVWDNAGNETVDPGGHISVTLDTTPPSGQILTPAEGTFLNEDAVYIEAEAFDNLGIDQVQFFAWYDDDWHYIDSDPDGSDGYQATWDAGGLSDRSGIWLDALILDRADNRWDATVENLTLDRTPPIGSVSVNGGATYAVSTAVTLDLEGMDEIAGVEQVMASNDAGFSGATWVDYATSLDWTVAAGDGTKTVYVKFRDGADNVSSIYSDTIILDTTPPTGSIVIQEGAEVTSDTQVTLALSASDAYGITHMRLRNDAAAWSAWEPFATDRAWTLPPQPGTHTVWVQFQDPAGNVSAAYSDSIAYQFSWRIQLPLIMRGSGP